MHHIHSVPCAEGKADTAYTITSEGRGFCEDLFFILITELVPGLCHAVVVAVTQHSHRTPPAF